MARTFTKDELNTRLIAADRKKEFGFAPIAEVKYMVKAQRSLVRKLVLSTLVSKV
jgi:hypothetical protein